MRGLAAVLVLFIILIPGGTLPGRELKKGTYYSPERIEKELLDWLNKERTERGLSPLLSHPVLEKVALGHSEKMVAEEKLSHYFPNYPPLKQRLMKTNLYFLTCGENVAFSESIIGKYIHQKFMSSEGHRKNMLDREYTHCGIKLARVEVKNDFYVTQVFAHLDKPLDQFELETLLEKYLQGQYRDAHKQPLLILEKMKQYARIISQLNARGRKIDNFLNSFPGEWGKLDVVNLISPRKEELKRELEKAAIKQEYTGAAVGTSHTRNARFPGGAYSVSLLLLESTVGNYTQENFRELVLEAINNLRREEDLVPMKLDKRLSVSANLMYEFRQLGLKEYLTEEDHARLKKAIAWLGIRKAQVFTYKTDNPRNIPSPARRMLQGNDETISRSLDKILILIHRPMIQGIPANYYMVTLVY